MCTRFKVQQRCATLATNLRQCNNGLIHCSSNYPTASSSIRHLHTNLTFPAGQASLILYSSLSYPLYARDAGSSLCQLCLAFERKELVVLHKRRQARKSSDCYRTIPVRRIRALRGILLSLATVTSSFCRDLIDASKLLDLSPTPALGKGDGSDMVIELVA